MVDISDLDAANSLYVEYQLIRNALANLAADGRIVSMTIASASGQMLIPATVPTDYIAYPPQMVDAIRTAFENRQQEILGKLANIGITGIEDRPRAQTQRRRR